MGSYSVSLTKNRDKKLDALRNATKQYKGMSNLEVINALLAEALDPIVLKE